MEGRVCHHSADDIGVSLRNAVKLDFENVANSVKNEPSELITFYGKKVYKEDRGRRVGKSKEEYFPSVCM